MLISRQQAIRLMEDALKEPVRIDCGAAASRARQDFYRARAYCDMWGDDRFKFLRFRIDGSGLTVETHPDPDAVERRYRLRALREAVSYALTRRNARDGMGDGTEGT